MSFGEYWLQRDRRGLGAALGSQELCGKSPPLLAIFWPGRAGETVRIEVNGGEEGIRTLDTVRRQWSAKRKAALIGLWPWCAEPWKDRMGSIFATQ
jgi:hypothetical protein